MQAEVATFEQTAPEERARAASLRDWRRLTEFAAVCMAVLDAGLLQRKHALFTGGFLSSAPFGTTADSLAFLIALVLLNATLTAPLCALGLFIAARVRLRPRATRFAAFSAAVLPLAAADFLSYQVWSYLGEAFDVGLVFDLTGRRVSEIFAVTAPLVTRPLGLGVLLSMGVLVITWSLHRVQRDVAVRVAVPAFSVVFRKTLVMFLLSGALVMVLAAASESMDFGLRWTPAGQVLGRVLNRLSDIDHDGYGLLRAPRDTAPFDSAIHPYALEVPGNGVDEDGLAGDLPMDRAVYGERPPPRDPWQARPPVILFVLESFRADVVGASYAQRPVTPVLDGLARRGVKVDSAWSHNGFTTQSRFHILSGSLTGGREGTSVLDDFKDHGYEVGYFSAQDDEFGGNPIRYDRVDTYYDARRDRDRRYTRYTTPGSLAVPMQVLDQRVRDFLGARQGTAPLFLYVNFHDTHYPYTHARIDNILGVEPLPQALISPARRGELWRTYLNTAANVDRAIGHVIDAVSANTGDDPAVIVISDHGESLFDRGFLGHGYALDDVQTRVPLIVTGLPMKIREPFGQADLRDAINAALAGKNGGMDNQPVAGRTRDARVFQYLGTLDAPAQIGWLTAAGLLTYDFRSDRVGLWGSSVKPEALVAEPSRLFRELVYTWESMRRERAALRGGH
jgi:hypothetical protein